MPCSMNGASMRSWKSAASLLVFHQLGSSGSVHKMAGGASNLIFGVSARDATAGCVLVQVTGKTGAVDFGGG